MNWLVFLFALEFGWLPGGTFIMYEREPLESVYLGGSFFTDMEAEFLLFNHFYIGGGAKTIMFKSNKGLVFDPQAVDYKFEAGIRIGIIDIFFRHHCIHPIMTYMYWYNTELIWEGWYNEIGIRIEGKIGGG